MFYPHSSQEQRQNTVCRADAAPRVQVPKYEVSTQTIITIPHAETLDTLYLGTRDPEISGRRDRRHVSVCSFVALEVQVPT